LRQIIAFTHFLDYTAAFARLNKTSLGKRVKHQRQIDINVEVRLLQEIKDILDELKIMGNIKQEQLIVAKTFAYHMH
jgi:hypothetical protein